MITYQEVVDDIIVVAKEAGIDPSEVNVAAYKKHGGRFTDRQIRDAAGGLTNVVKKEFPVETKNLGVIRGVKLRNTYVNKLEKQVGDIEYIVDRLSYEFAESLKSNPIRLTDPKKLAAKKSKKVERFNIAHLSDNHFGISTSPDEVPNNEYNWSIAARRLGNLAEEIGHYKLDHRGQCGGLIVNLGGDQIAGRIHLDDKNIDLLAMQVIGTIRMLVSFIDYQRNYYSNIYVKVSPGNHDRSIDSLRGKQRALAQKYDSYLTVIAEGIRQAFRHDSGVDVFQPMTPYTTYKVFGHNFLLFHGDTVLSLGNPSKAIDIKTLTAMLNSFNSTTPESERINVAFAGHVHAGTYSWLDNGVHLFINPSMIGVDTFAQGIGIHNSPVGQWLVESTREYPAGDMRLVNVKSADKESRFEKIIPVYRGTLN